MPPASHKKTHMPDSKRTPWPGQLLPVAASVFFSILKEEKVTTSVMKTSLKAIWCLLLALECFLSIQDAG